MARWGHHARLLLRITSAPVLLLAVTAFATESVVWTLDGRRFEGDARFATGEIVITRARGEAVHIAASNIARAQFSTNVIAAQTRGSGNGLLGLYYPNTNFTGSPIMRLDETVEFDWRQKEPMLGIPRNSFSVRWMAQLEAPTTDAYTIYFTTDSGGRIFLDDKLLAENWNRTDHSEIGAAVHLEAGKRHNLKLEYFNSSATPRARLWWSTRSMPRAIVPQDRLYAASFDSQHQGDASGLAGAQGLLGTYYAGDNFLSNSFTRIDPEIDFAWKGESPAPGMPGINFSVRWTGTLLPTNSGDYEFYVMSGVPIRLFINDRLISNPNIVALQESASAKLDHRERNELRLEMRATNNVVPVKLAWSGPGFAKTVIARQHLSPVITPSRDAPLGSGPLQPTGIVLLNGAIVSAPIQSANNSSIRLQGVLAKTPVALTRVARIHVKPLSADLVSAIPKGRAGVLLKNRDFIDGDFAGIENGKLKIESVLFGNRTFDLAKDVVAVVLRGNEPPPWKYSLTARDGTVLYGRTMAVTTAGIVVGEIREMPLLPMDLSEVVLREDVRPGAGLP